MAHRPPSPLDYWRNAVEVSLVMAEAQSVMTMRLLGMAGAWPVPKSESLRMVNEKVAAFAIGGAAAGLAAAMGARPETVAAAAIDPIRKTTRANHRRLARPGLKGL